MYPDYRRVPYQDIRHRHLIGFVMSQIPDYNQAGVGYVAESDGARVMAGVMSAHPLALRPFVGIIDSKGSLEGLDMRRGTLGFLRRIVADFLSLENTFLLLYSRLPFIQPIFRLFYIDGFPEFHRSVLKKELFAGLRSIDLPGNLDIHVFSSRIKQSGPVDRLDMMPGTGLRLVPLNSGSGDVFHLVNRRRMIEFIKVRV